MTGKAPIIFPGFQHFPGAVGTLKTGCHLNELIPDPNMSARNSHQYLLFFYNV